MVHAFDHTKEFQRLRHCLDTLIALLQGILNETYVLTELKANILVLKKSSWGSKVKNSLIITETNHLSSYGLSFGTFLAPKQE